MRSKRHRRPAWHLTGAVVLLWLAACADPPPPERNGTGPTAAPANAEPHPSAHDIDARRDRLPRLASSSPGEPPGAVSAWIRDGEPVLIETQQPGTGTVRYHFHDGRLIQATLAHGTTAPQVIAYGADQESGDATAQAAAEQAQRLYTHALALSRGARGNGPLLACTGDEPAWDLRLGGGMAELDVFGATPQRFTGGYRYDQPFASLAGDWRGSAGNGGELFAAVRDSDCFTRRGTDAPRPLAISVTRADGTGLTGCCSNLGTTPARPHGGVGPDSADALPVADLAAKPDFDWSRDLRELLPAIRSCLAKVAGRGAIVVKAWPMARARTSVRLLGPGGDRVDCIAPADGGPVEKMGMVGDVALPLPGEGRPMFVPALHEPPIQTCTEVERVLDDSGRLVGWLVYRHC